MTSGENVARERGRNNAYILKSTKTTSRAAGLAEREGRKCPIESKVERAREREGRANIRSTITPTVPPSKRLKRFEKYD